MYSGWIILFVVGSGKDDWFFKGAANIKTAFDDNTGKGFEQKNTSLLDGNVFPCGNRDIIVHDEWIATALQYYSFDSSGKVGLCGCMNYEQTK